MTIYRSLPSRTQYVLDSITSEALRKDTFLFIPIRANKHWTLLSLNLRSKQFTHYNSAAGIPNSVEVSLMVRVLLK